MSTLLSSFEKIANSNNLVSFVLQDNTGGIILMPPVISKLTSLSHMEILRKKCQKNSETTPRFKGLFHEKN